MTPSFHRHRSITRILGFIGVLLSSTLAADPSQGAPSPRRQTDAVRVNQPSGSITLTSQTPVVGPDGQFVVTADYKPTTTAGPGTEAQGDEVAVAVYERVTDRSSLFDSIDGVRLGSPIVLRTTKLSAPDANGTFRIANTLTVGKCDTCVPIETDGVYPVSIDVRRRTGAGVGARVITHMLVQQSTASPRFDVALIIPITVASTLNKDGTYRSEPATKLAAASESLASHPGIALSVVLTPSVVDRARVDTAVNGAIDTLNTALAQRELLATPYEALHPRIQHDGRLGQILLGQWKQGAQVLESRFGDSVITDTWVVQPTDELPDRDGLSQIAPQRLIVDGSLVAQNNPGDFVQSVGARSIPNIIDTPLVYDTGVVFEATSNDTVIQEESQEDSSAITSIVTDPLLTNHLRANNPVLGVSALLADLMVGADVTDTERPGVAVAIPSEAVTRQTLDLLLAGLAANRELRPVVASSLFELPIGTTPDEELISIGRKLRNSPVLSPAYLNALDDSRRKIDGAAWMLGSRENASEVTFTLADRLFSAALSDPNAGNAFASETDPELTNRTLLVASRQAAEAVMLGVGLADGGPFRFTALRGRVPITIENPTGGPILVHLSVEQSRVRIRSDSAEQDILVEQGTQVVSLDVETLSSGRFDVRVVLSTNGVVLSRNAYTVRSTGVSGIGVTLTLTLLVLLGLWWLSTRRKHRNVNRPGPTTPVEKTRTEAGARG
jgi:uncharacterized protein (TIGR03382 family)